MYFGKRVDCASDQPASKDSEVDPIIDVYPEDSKEYPDFFQKIRSNTYRGAPLDGRLKQKSYLKHLTRKSGVSDDTRDYKERVC